MPIADSHASALVPTGANRALSPVMTGLCPANLTPGLVWCVPSCPSKKCCYVNLPHT